ncbi:MAG TPA: DUF2934 domain-containing protein [Verrucomicrobiae bacterium]|jgi:hypothetical protein|nr:DUF2934 domain-containing protein [Verrucomicrobiae bacterium]
MPKAKTPRTIKPKAEKKVLQMPEASNGNGSASPNLKLESEIRERAYEIYAKRGYTNGREAEDWLEAEREVLAHHGNRVQTA